MSQAPPPPPPPFSRNPRPRSDSRPQGRPTYRAATGPEPSAPNEGKPRKTVWGMPVTSGPTWVLLAAIFVLFVLLPLYAWLTR